MTRPPPTGLEVPSHLGANVVGERWGATSGRAGGESEPRPGDVRLLERRAVPLEPTAAGGAGDTHDAPTADGGP